MSFSESGSDPEYLVLGHFSTADQRGRYWPSAGMIVSNPSNSVRRVEQNAMTGACQPELYTRLNWMSAKEGFTGLCPKFEAVFKSHVLIYEITQISW